MWEKANAWQVGEFALVTFIVAIIAGNEFL
jgi:hypothetical protein